jgi:hypothetical protein
MRSGQRKRRVIQGRNNQFRKSIGLATVLRINGGQLHDVSQSTSLSALHKLLFPRKFGRHATTAGIHVGSGRGDASEELLKATGNNIAKEVVRL